MNLFHSAYEHTSLVQQVVVENECHSRLRYSSVLDPETGRVGVTANAVKWLAAVKSTKRTLSRLSGDLVD
jgi:hypothetical protein